ncbi:hypothetical protein [Halarcobacter sp.]|uniref:hypothetical protein n=1 Tax=Halarcobacter sp. TaxID=2321133 RepID=UPI0029F50295|nr:hypothetical protein [Halarcobacter sp.]
MSLFIVSKIIHILSAIFFMSVVSFRTFIMPAIKKMYGNEIYLKSEKAVGFRARKIIIINNLFLIGSGLYLFSFHIQSMTLLFHFKIAVGLLLALSFYIVPLIMKRFNHISWFSTFFHHLYFILMITTVILSQIMFT